MCFMNCFKESSKIKILLTFSISSPRTVKQPVYYTKCIIETIFDANHKPMVKQTYEILNAHERNSKYTSP